MMNWNDMTERQKDFFARLARDTEYSLDTLVWAWDHIADWLDDHEGEGVDAYGADLGFEITLNENNDGFVDDPYTYNAKEWIKGHFDDCAVYWEYEKFNYGENKTNPFDEPVTYKLLIYINVVRDIIASLPYIDDHWDDNITLTPDVIAHLRYELCMTDDCPPEEPDDCPDNDSDSNEDNEEDGDV